MKVTLTAEGTYPHQFGGVSVWCDQLVRTLPGYQFDVVALVATGAEPVRWELPPNVTRLTTVPLWSQAPAGPWQAGAAPWRNLTPRPRGRGVPAPVRELIATLLDAPSPGLRHAAPPTGEALGWVLRDLHEFATDGGRTGSRGPASRGSASREADSDPVAARTLTAALSSGAAARLLCDSWRERWPAMAATAGLTAGVEPPSLHDAVTVLRLVEHALRPLARPPARADLTHVVTNGLGALPALTAKWRHGTPLVVSEHGVFLREQYLHLRRPPFGWPVKELYLRFLSQLCTLGYREAELVVPGNVYNRRWESQLGAEPARVRTVYNGVDPAEFPLITTEPAEPTISWAGRIDPIKDLETLLRAHSLVVAEMPGARLRIFGSAARGQEAYLKRCQDLARSLGIADVVTFEGRVENITDAYAAGTIVVLCSISEGFPYSLIEAMTCGRPCVGTDVGGVAEALAGGFGLLVPPRDPASLAERCLRLLRDPVKREVLGAAARRRALEHFTIARAIGAFDEIYQLVAASRTGSGRGGWDEGAGMIRSAEGLSPVMTEGWMA